MIQFDRHWWIRDLGWLFASAGTVLFVTAGLLFFAHLEGNRAGLATGLLTLYAASWWAVSAAVTAVFFASWWIMGARRYRKLSTIHVRRKVALRKVHEAA